MTSVDGEDDYAALIHGAPGAPPVEDCKRETNGRFKSPFSGNPKGRPKKEERAWSNRQLSKDILKEANREILVQINGKTESISMFALMLRQQINKAAKGDDKAFKMAYSLITNTQSWYENKNWKFFEILEKAEMSFEEASELFSKEAAIESRNRWRKKSRKI